MHVLIHLCNRVLNGVYLNDYYKVNLIGQWGNILVPVNGVCTCIYQKFFDQRNQMALEFFSQIFKNSTAAVYSSDKLPIGEVDTNTNESGTCSLYLAAFYLWYFPTFPVRSLPILFC